MGRRPAPGAVPPARPREALSLCDRACCWTPFGHSAVATDCTCHREDA